MKTLDHLHLKIVFMEGHAELKLNGDVDTLIT